MIYSRRTSNSVERIILSNLTHMINIVDLIAISVEITKLDSGCSLEKDFIKLISMNL